MNNKALLIIDVQEGMFTVEGFDPYKGEALLENISKVLKKARDKGVPVVYIQHTTEDGYFKKGTEKWNIQSKIAPVDGEKVIQKGFCDSFQETGLKQVFDELEVTDLVIMGMQTEFCVDTTFRSAFNLGYKSTLVSDGHSTFDNEVLDAKDVVAHHNRVLGNFGEVKTTDEIEF